MSYKEDSDEKTDSDDVLEVDNGESQEGNAESETTAETIEKVIAQRTGKKGGQNFGIFDRKIQNFEVF